MSCGATCCNGLQVRVCGTHRDLSKLNRTTAEGVYALLFEHRPVMEEAYRTGAATISFPWHERLKASNHAVALPLLESQGCMGNASPNDKRGAGGVR